MKLQDTGTPIDIPEFKTDSDVTLQKKLALLKYLKEQSATGQPPAQALANRLIPQQEDMTIADVETPLPPEELVQKTRFLKLKQLLGK